MAIYDNRICKECGIKFSGGPRAWYCPNCRKERQKKQAENQNQGKGWVKQGRSAVVQFAKIAEIFIPSAVQIKSIVTIVENQ